MKNEFNKNNAFSMALSESSEESKDQIQYLIKLQGSLYAFADNYISKILPAESIDPQNTQLETRHSHQKIYSIGCANSWVARSIIQTKQILDSIILIPNINKQSILDHTWSCTEMLLHCESAYYSIYKETLDLMPKSDAIIEGDKKGAAISTLPQVEDLNGKVAVFLGNAKRFLKKTHELLCIFYNAPNNSSNFQAYRDWLTKNKPDKKEIIELLEKDKDWIKQLSFMRNAHDINHAEANFNLEIVNFKLYPGNKFSSPGWRFDFSGRQGSKQANFSDIVTNMDIHISNLLTFFEELLVLCIIGNSDKNYNFEIYRKQLNDINPKCPSVYSVAINKNR
ncbi:MAG: hypothetical protein ABSF79_07850 [Smithellaceae bacterium]|jgi:hypothetical protein